MSWVAKRDRYGILPTVLLAEQLQQTLQGQYRIVRELTRGGMSRVFLARDIKLERDVAINVLSPDLVEPTLVERFRLATLVTTVVVTEGSDRAYGLALPRR